MFRPITRRNLLALSASFAALGALGEVSPPAVAQSNWPEREVRFINPSAAGSGGIDALSRLMAEKLKERLGQSFVVENVPGTGGSIGVGRLAKSAPDGYTIGLTGDAAMVVNSHLYKSVPYDTVKDITPIIMIGRTSNVLVVNADTGPKSLADLIAQAKAKPGTITFNSNGYGTSQHLGFELLKKAAAIEILHTPSRTPTLADILGGHVTASFMNITVALQNVREGKLRALAVSGLGRSAVLPDVQTVAEQGFPGFNASAWFGLIAPAGTPSAIIEKVNAEAAAALAEPEFRAKLVGMGVQIADKNSPQQFAAFVRSELPRMGELIRATGIKLD